MSEQKIEFTLNGKETEVSYESGDSLLDTAIRQGLNPPYSCMEGMCTACIAKLTEGELDFPEDTILDESEVRAGKILTCQATVKKGCVLVKVNYDNLG